MSLLFVLIRLTCSFSKAVDQDEESIGIFNWRGDTWDDINVCPPGTAAPIGES